MILLYGVRLIDLYDSRNMMTLMFGLPRGKTMSMLLVVPRGLNVVMTSKQVSM